MLIVLDEAYFEYVDCADYPHGRDYYADHPNLILLRTFSKIYGLAGLRLGYGIARPEIIAAIHRVRPPFNVSSLAQAAGLGALEDHAFTKRTAELNRVEMARVTAALRDLKITFLPSLGNFLMIEVGDGPAFTERLIREGIIVRPIANYGFPKHVRVTLGLPGQNDRFLAAAKHALGK